MIRQVKQDLMLEGRSDMASRVMSYRSGYSAQVRSITSLISITDDLLIS